MKKYKDHLVINSRSDPESSYALAGNCPATSSKFEYTRALNPSNSFACSIAYTPIPKESQLTCSFTPIYMTGRDHMPSDTR